MKNIDNYFELLDLRNQLDLLTTEVQDSQEKSRKLDFLLRLRALSKSFPDIDTLLAKRVEDYIVQYAPAQLYLNDNFAREKGYLRGALDAMQRTFLEQSSNDISYSLEEKVDALLGRRFRRSRIFQLGVALLVALIGFASYGVLKIKGYSIDVNQTVKEAVSKGQDSIHAAVRNATKDIDRVEKDYKEVLLGTAKENAAKYDQELKAVADAKKEQLQANVNDFVVQLRSSARPDIENAIGKMHEDFGELRGKVVQLKAQVDQQDGIIKAQESSLANTSRLLEDFKKSPDKNIIDKVAAALRLSHLLLWCILGLSAIALLLSLIGILQAGRALKRLNKSRGR